MVEFKENDLVYYPTATNAIVKLEKSDSVTEYPLLGTWASLGNTKKCVTRFLSDGRVSFSHQYSSIFPATQEWYEKLVVIYPDLEKPPKRKDPIEVIEAMFEDGWCGVTCYVSNRETNPDKHNAKFSLLVSTIEDGKVCGQNGYRWTYAVPFDVRTDKIIIDYVDGEVVLED